MRKFVPLVLSIASATVGCSTALPTQQPVSTSPLRFAADERLAVQNVFVVTDASGTMWVNRTFPEAKAQTQSFVSAMPDGDYAASGIGFGGDDRAVAPLDRFDRRTLSREADSLSIMGALDGRGGTTPLHDVFTEIGESLEGRRGDVGIVLFSDGLPDEPGLAMATAQAVAELYPGKVCIHGVQSGDDPEGAGFLRGLASIEGCGSYRKGSDLASASQFTALSRQVFAGKVALPPVSAPRANPCTENLRLQGVEFGFDKATISANGADILSAAARQLSECREVKVQIDGYTDSIGTVPYNEGLSQRRAQAARKFLINQGVEADRITTRGFGKSDPVAPNDTAEGRAMNRRVELHPAR